MNRIHLRLRRLRVATLLFPCLAAVLLLAPGCRHAGKHGQGNAPPPLEPQALEGERLLLVPTTPTAVALAGELVRHLSVLPVRPTRPAEFGDEAVPGEERLAWQEWAWERRIPYLLMVGVSDDEEGSSPGLAGPVIARAELIPAREGEVVWEAEFRSALPRAVPVDLRARLREDLGVPPERPDGHPTSWPTVPAGELDGLATMALVEPGDPAAARLSSAREQYPLDPSLMDLEAALAAAGGRPSNARTLALGAQTVNPQGRSELPRLARDARRAGLDLRAEGLWDVVARAWPGRVDYALEYADLLGEDEAHDRAADVLLDAASRLMPEDQEIPEDLASRPDRAVVLTRLARVGDLRYLLGWHLYSTGEFDAAVASYTEAIVFFEAVEEPESIASCHNNIGVTLIEAGRPLPALSYLKRALLARTSREPSQEQANTLYNLGSAYEACGRMLEARDSLEQAAAFYDELEAFGDAFDTRLDLVILEGEIGTSESVEKAFEVVLSRAAERVDEQALRAEALGAVGVARARVDRFEESLEALEQALAAWIELGDRLREGQTRYSMAITFLGQGEHDKAIETLGEARRIAEELNDIESMVAIDVQIEQIEQLR